MITTKTNKPIFSPPFIAQNTGNNKDKIYPYYCRYKGQKRGLPSSILKSKNDVTSINKIDIEDIKVSGYYIK